jgi:hypothetical protein
MITTYQDSVSSLGSFLKDVPYLSQSDEYSFENFLRLYLTKDNQFYFNILSTQIFIDGELNPTTYYTIRVNKRVPWTTLSYNEYRNMNLWWLIMIVNKIRNPLNYPEPGTELKILYPNYVRFVIDKITEKHIK